MIDRISVVMSLMFSMALAICSAGAGSPSRAGSLNLRIVRSVISIVATMRSMGVFPSTAEGWVNFRKALLVDSNVAFMLSSVSGSFFMAWVSFSWFSSSPSMPLDGFQRRGGVLEDRLDVLLGLRDRGSSSTRVGRLSELFCWPPSALSPVFCTVSIGSSSAFFSPVGSSETLPLRIVPGAMSFAGSRLVRIGG